MKLPCDAREVLYSQLESRGFLKVLRQVDDDMDLRLDPSDWNDLVDVATDAILEHLSEMPD